MNEKWTTYSRCSRAAGLTLIEVVAAIAILGTILVGIVLAKSRLTRQLVEADQRLAAVRAADELIAGWWTRDAGVPVDDAGVVDDHPEWSWRTHVMANPLIERWGARVVRVEVRPSEGHVVALPGQPPVEVIVDLVLADPEVEAAEAAVRRKRSNHDDEQDESNAP